MPRSRGRCIIESCKNHDRITMIIGRGMCPTCYSRWKRGAISLPLKGDETSVCGNPECAKVFIQDPDRKRQSYCSDRCRNRAQKLRSKGYEKKRRAAQGFDVEKHRRAIEKTMESKHPWSLQDDPWPTIHPVGAFGLPVPMSTSVQPWGM